MELDHKAEFRSPIITVVFPVKKRVGIFLVQTR